MIVAVVGRLDRWPEDSVDGSAQSEIDDLLRRVNVCLFFIKGVGINVLYQVESCHQVGEGIGSQPRVAAARVCDGCFRPRVSWRLY